MDTIFMNSENNKISDPRRILLNLSNKINFKRSDKYVPLSNLTTFYTRKNKKKSYKNNKFQISAPTGNEEFKFPDGSYSLSGILNIFFILNIKTVSDIPSITIYVNKIENRITFKIKTGSYSQLLSPETRKLLGSTKNKITKDKNGENATHLEVNEVILVHCNIVSNNYQHPEFCIRLFLINHLVNY